MPFYASDEEIQQLEDRIDEAKRHVDYDYAEKVADLLRYWHGSAAIDVVMQVLAAKHLVDNDR